MKKKIVTLLCVTIVALSIFSCKKETVEPEKELGESPGTIIIPPSTKPDLDVAETLRPV